LSFYKTGDNKLASEVGELVQHIVEMIVDNPDDVNITEAEEDRTTTIEINTNKEDVGKIIGKSGSMAKALRTICSALSGKHDKRYIVLIRE